MKFSNLLEILKSENLVSDVSIIEDCEILDLNFMDQMDGSFSDFSWSTVYFLDASQLWMTTPVPSCVLYYNEVPDYKRKDMVNAAKIPAESIASVFRLVKAQLDMAPQAQQVYTESISKLVMGKDISSVLSELSSRTGILYAIIDISGKILANTNPFSVDFAQWVQSAERGFCNENIMKYIEKLRNSGKFPGGESPFVLYCAVSKRYILCSRIIHESNLMGYFFAFHTSPNFDNLTMRLIPMLVQKTKDSLMRLKGFDDYLTSMRRNILSDAIAGASPLETQQRAKVASLKFPDSMCVMVMRPLSYKEYGFLEYVLQPAVSKVLAGNTCFPWQSYLVAVLPADENGNLTAEMEKAFTEIAEEYHVLVGISNSFSDIAQFSRYYDQAQTALSFSKRFSYNKPLFYYLDYAFFVLLDHEDGSQTLDQYCHPALAKLQAYDEENNTELFETLMLYTQTGFSKSRTTKKLFLHRNSVAYRLQQIEEICGIDLSDEKLLFTMQISFNIYIYQKKTLALSELNAKKKKKAAKMLLPNAADTRE